VAETVVDHLEVVQVDEEHGQAAALAERGPQDALGAAQLVHGGLVLADQVGHADQHQQEQTRPAGHDHRDVEALVAQGLDGEDGRGHQGRRGQAGQYAEPDRDHGGVDHAAPGPGDRGRRAQGPGHEPDGLPGREQLERQLPGGLPEPDRGQGGRDRGQAERDQRPTRSAGSGRYM
jgi:hypothetical protein